MKSALSAFLALAAIISASVPTHSLAQANGHSGVGEGRNFGHAFANSCRRVQVWHHHHRVWVERCDRVYCGFSGDQIQPYVGNYYDGEYEKYLESVLHPTWAYERATGHRCPND